MSERRCEHCRWWNRHSGLATGDCQKRPPNSITSKWPSTDEADFCGEWADKNITPEQAERRELVRRFAVAIVEGMCASNSSIGCTEFPAFAWKRAEQIAEAEGQQ